MKKIKMMITKPELNDWYCEGCFATSAKVVDKKFVITGASKSAVQRLERMMNNGFILVDIENRLSVAFEK